MSLITPQPKIDRERVCFGLERANARDLRAYAEWIKSSQEWAINRALEYVFTRDRDFQRWLAARGSTPSEEKQ